MVSERIQWLIVVLLALLLLLVGALCYKKDNFYDFALEGTPPPENPYIRKYFKDTGADIEQSITDRRHLIACEGCKNYKETPGICTLCQQYVQGHNMIKEGVI